MSTPSTPAPLARVVHIDGLHARWISRFRGHFGEPIGLDEFRAGDLSFRDLYERNMRFAEAMLAEVQQIHSDAFND